MYDHSPILILEWIIVTEVKYSPNTLSPTLFSEIALNRLLQLLRREVSEHIQHLHQYFQVFLNYANRGAFEVCSYDTVEQS